MVRMNWGRENDWRTQKGGGVRATRKGGESSAAKNGKGSPSRENGTDTQ